MKRALIASALIAVLSQANALNVIGFYPNWDTYAKNYQPADIPAQSLTEIVYAFAQVGNCAKPYATEANPGLCHQGPYATGQQDYRLHSTDPYSDFNRVPYRAGYKLAGTKGRGNISKVLNLGRPVLLSIGGSNLSVPLQTAMDSAHRVAFVQSVVDFFNQVKQDARGKAFVGVDIDFEPNANQWTIADAKGGYQKLDNVIQLLKDLKSALPEGENEISLAVPGDPDVIMDVDRHYDNHFWSMAAQYADHFNVITYDYHGKLGSERYTGFNAPLYFDPTQPSSMRGYGKFNAKTTMETYMRVNVPVGRLYLSIPTHGRVYGNVHPRGKPMGLYQRFSGPGLTATHDGFINYRNLVTDPAWVKSVDYDAGQMTAYNKSKAEFVTFDNPETVKDKAAYVKDNHLGGIMFWELSGDLPKGNDQSLVHTAAVI